MELTERLRAALDETERVARAAFGDSVFDGTGIVVGPQGTAVLLSTAARHIAHQDPTRTLRMVAAHRKLLAHVEAELADDPTDDTAAYLLETLAEAYGVEA